MNPATIRETILFAFTRNAGVAEIALTDETAFMIMSILDDLWLWFDTVYGDQAHRYAPEEVPLGDRPPEDLNTGGDPPDLFDDPLDPF
ncbi:hypothetical protein [Burkholderia ubonensis]|uniref:hypothetical protein n=1 Tax=Burkholderia ubonensis TaxID=101571 RepID=UPI000752C001|nr:hypothetical protein [Burkholderia ubonensis]KVD63986.1 hypothetical protein WI88_08840 [Burkholderia ubonensis]